MPYLDDLVMRIDAATQVLAPENGEIDFLWGVPGPQQSRLAADARVRMAQTAYNPGGGSNCIMTISLPPAVFKDRAFDTNMISYCNGPDPEIGVRRMYHSSQIGPAPFTNAAAFRNPQVAGLFDDASRTVERDKRSRIYRQIPEIAVRELPYFWLVETQSTRAWSTRCSGFKPWRGTTRSCSASSSWCRSRWCSPISSRMSSVAGSIPASATSEVLVPAGPARPAGARVWSVLSRGLGIGITGLLVAVALLAGRLAPGDPFATVAPPLQPPSRLHVMGTDDVGRDLWSGVVHGARTSLIVAGGVTVLALFLGLVVGGVSGWRGSIVDNLLMRRTEFVQVVPRFFLAVVVIALLGPGLDRLVMLLGLTSWPLIARVVRAEVHSLKTRDFVEAARALGAPEIRIVWREILPAVLPAAIVVASVNASGVILLGGDPPRGGALIPRTGDPHVVSWGYLANNAQRFLRVAWWMVLFTGVAIALAVLGFTSVSAPPIASPPTPSTVRASSRWLSTSPPSGATRTRPSANASGCWHCSSKMSPCSSSARSRRMSASAGARRPRSRCPGP